MKTDKQETCPLCGCRVVRIHPLSSPSFGDCPEPYSVGCYKRAMTNRDVRIADLEAMLKRLRIDASDEATEGWEEDAGLSYVYAKGTGQVSLEDGAREWMFWAGGYMANDGVVDSKELAQRRASFEAKEATDE